VKNYLTWGAGPRAAQYLVLGAKSRSLLHGRFNVSTEDVRAVAHPVLRHRIMTNFSAEAEGVKPDDVVAQMIDFASERLDQQDARGKLPEVFRSEDPGQA